MTMPNAPANQSPFLDDPLWDEFFSLASAKDLPGLLRQAAQITAQAFGAAICSLFFFGEPAQYIRTGQGFKTICEHIDRLEKAVHARLKDGVWRIAETDAPPISIQRFSQESAIVLNTPLLKSTRVIGSLSLVLPQNAPPSAAHRAAFTRLSRGIGQVASFAADLSQAQQLYKELDLIYQVGQALVSTLELNQLLKNVMRLSANVLDAAAASIMLIDEDKQQLVFEASHSPAQALLNKHRISLDEGIAGWVATNGRPVIVNNVHADPRFNRKVDVRTGFLTQSIAAVPIKLKSKTVGVLEVLNKRAEAGFNRNDLRLMTSIAAQTAIALENAKLYQSLREERDKIINAQEEVRKELSRNLHDGAVQQLSAISMNLEYAKKLMPIDPEAAMNELSKIQDLAHRAAKEARLVLFELRPIILETHGLLPTLERYVAQLNETESFTVEAELAAIPIQLKKNVAGTIFSIIQEAVNNIKRHATASNVKITVATRAGQLLVYIKDDGAGFDTGAVQTGYFGRNSLGLLNMKERAELLNGILVINSETGGPRHGTTVTLSVPVKPGTGMLNKSLVSSEDYESDR